MRDLTAAFIAELEADSKTVALFYQGEFASGTVYYWSGIGTIDVDGTEYIGFGGLLRSISKIKETSDIKAQGIAITVSGISEEMRSIILSEARQGKPGMVFIGFIKPDGSVVADPAVAFDGRLDVPSQGDDGQEITISLSYENRLRDLERLREFRYTNESQKILYPDDVGFEYVPSLQEWNGVWGKK